MLYVFLELVVYTQLPYTPRFILLLFIVGAVVYLLLRGLEGWVRWGELFAIFLLISLISINVSQLTNASFGNLLPFSDAFYKPTHYLKPELLAGLFIFRGMFFIYFLYPHIKQTHRLFRWSTLSLTIAFFAVLVSVVLPITIFGAPFAGKLTYPYQESLGTVALLWLPLERITILTPIVWQLIVVYVLCASLFSAVRGIKTLLHIKKEQNIIYVLGALTLVTTMVPFQQTTVFTIMVYWALTGMVVFIVIPSLLWLILAMRGGKTK